MVKDMESVCKISGEELLEVDTFLASEKFRKYEESLFAMSEVVFKFAINDVKESTSKVVH